MRKPRRLIENGLYHVVARANRKEFIFYPDEIKLMFLAVVKEAKCKFHFSLTNFCIMNNHFHIMIKPGQGENLSRIMQWILSVFALRFNKRLGYTGHVWYDRFKSKIVAGFSDFLHTFRYIALNPVRAGIVGNPLAYPFNGVRFIRDKDPFLRDETAELLVSLDPIHYEPRLLPSP